VLNLPYTCGQVPILGYFEMVASIRERFSLRGLTQVVWREVLKPGPGAVEETLGSMCLGLKNQTTSYKPAGHPGRCNPVTHPRGLSNRKQELECGDVYVSSSKMDGVLSSQRLT
jgi:hypothetical protein